MAPSKRVTTTSEDLAALFREHSKRKFLFDASSGTSVTYGDIWRNACRAAEVIGKNGARPGDRVAFLLENSAEYFSLYLACAFSSTIAVPINIRLHVTDIGFILASSKPKIILFDPKVGDFSSLLLPLAHLTHCLELRSFLHEVGREGEERFNLSSMNDLFSIHYTSGTTAQPKGVSHRLSALTGNAQAFNQATGVGRSSVLYHILPMSYMAGFLNSLLSPLMAGGSVVLTRGFDAQLALHFWKDAAQGGANMFWLTPTILRSLMKMDRSENPLSYLGNESPLAFVGTAPLSLTLREDFEKKYHLTLLESYGLSELLFITVNSTFAPRESGAVGKCLSGIDMKIEDRNDEEGNRGGEILVRTPYRMAGYWDAVTQAPLSTDEWFATGDVGTLSKDGFVTIRDRIKDLIIKGGTNLSPRKIEEVLLQHPDVEQAAVIGIPHEFYGEDVGAVVIAKKGKSESDLRASLIAHCKERLASIAVPERIAFMTEFPMTSSGKVQKRKLRTWLSAEQA